MLLILCYGQNHVNLRSNKTKVVDPVEHVEIRYGKFNVAHQTHDPQHTFQVDALTPTG